MEKRKGFNPLERNISANNKSFSIYDNTTKSKKSRYSFLTGFTLIELLVVISIIALLLAILFPSLRRVRNNARAVVCQSNLKQWGTIFAIYSDTNKGNLPFLLSDGLIPYYRLTRSKNLINENIKSEIYFCPMAARKGNRSLSENFSRHFNKEMEGSPYDTKSIYALGPGILGSAFESWAYEDANDPVSGSYGPNFIINSPYFWTRYQLKWEGPIVYSLKGQSNIPILLDSAYTFSIFVWEGQKPPATEEESTSCCINRHDGGVNCLFLDWSVRKVGLKELWKLKWHKEFNTNGPWTTAGGVKPEDWPEWMREFKDY